MARPGEITAPKQADRSSADPAVTTDVTAVPAMAWRAVGAVAGALVVVLIATSAGYGYFADEMYFLWAGEHLSWSYADQPPLLPLLTQIMQSIVPGSVVALRVPAALMLGAGALLTGLIARELGGGRRAQVMASAAFAVAPFMVLFGRYLATSTVDIVLTSCLFWLVLRWVRVRDDRLLLWAGVTIAVALQAKYLIVFFLAVAAVAAMVFGPREILRRRQLWLGVAIAAVSVIPAVLWQWSNDWPQLRMGSRLTDEVGVMVMAGPVDFLLFTVMYSWIIGTVLLVAGLRELLRRPAVRFVGVTFVGAVVLFILLGWSAHLLAVMYPVMWAAGGVAVERFRGRWFMPVAVVTYVMTAGGMIFYQLPVLPLSQGADTLSRPVVAGTAGWEEVVESVTDVRDGLPADERENTVVVTARYEMASAMVRFGPDHDLPAAYSPHRGAWYFDVPPDSASTVVWVGDVPDELREHFADFRLAGSTDNGYDIDTDWQGLPIWVGTGQQAPWSEIWPELRHL